MADANSTRPTDVQIYWVLSDIATSAKTIERFAITITEMGNPCEDARDMEAARIAIQSIAQRIGFLADMTAGTMSSLGETFSTKAEDWMLPPAYHDEKGRRSQGENHA